MFRSAKHFCTLARKNDALEGTLVTIFVPSLLNWATPRKFGGSVQSCNERQSDYGHILICGIRTGHKESSQFYKTEYQIDHV